MRGILLTALLLNVIFLSVCAQVQTIKVNPVATDPQIQSIHGDHVAYIDPAVKPLNKLFLMIVGTTAAADHNIPFFEFTASMGYHVISLDYKNNVITTVCSKSEDRSCFINFRQEIMFGEQVSPLVEVDSANSIYHRFYALLVYLSKKYPKQGWQQFIDGKGMQWPKIIVGGHSQGAGHAAYIGKKFPVSRALIFAGPQDYLVKYSSPAAWLSQKGRTPPSKYFAFLHVKDPYDFTRQQADCLKLMEVVKPDTMLVQPATTAFKNKHILVANIETDNPHESMMQPAFKKAWAYLLSQNPAK